MSVKPKPVLGVPTNPKNLCFLCKEHKAYPRWRVTQKSPKVRKAQGKRGKREEILKRKNHGRNKSLTISNHHKYKWSEML
jgi:hypothetical protein